jgi:hypothetical protein
MRQVGAADVGERFVGLADPWLFFRRSGEERRQNGGD